MRTASLSPDRPAHEAETWLVPDEDQRAAVPPRRRRVEPVLGMLAGAALLVVAGTLLAGLQAVPADSQAAPAVEPSTITLSARDISVVSQVYAPGEASGWHAHSGIHAVAVLSGVLTVYDAQCRAETFVPGRPYVGGQDLHLVRNEGDVPVEMAVTYLSPTTGAGPTRRLPPPAACPVG